MSCPTGLKAYEDVNAAKRAMVRVQSSTGQSLEVYRCGKCYDWHVGRILTPGRERPD